MSSDHSQRNATRFCALELPRGPGILGRCRAPHPTKREPIVAPKRVFPAAHKTQTRAVPRVGARRPEGLKNKTPKTPGARRLCCEKSNDRATKQHGEAASAARVLSPCAKPRVLALCRRSGSSYDSTPYFFRLGCKVEWVAGFSKTDAVERSTPSRRDSGDVAWIEY